MKGYSTIGVGAKPDDHMGSTAVRSVRSNVQSQGLPEKDVEGLGYEIDLEEGMIDVSAEMARGEGSSSCSRDIVLGEPSLEVTDTVQEAFGRGAELEEREIEFPSPEEMKVMQDRLSGSDVGKSDLVDMVGHL
jgi:hypothetical protein